MAVTTRPTPNGGTALRSVSVTRGLQGTGLISDVSYRAVEVTGTIANQLALPELLAIAGFAYTQVRDA